MTSSPAVAPVPPETAPAPSPRRRPSLAAIVVCLFLAQIMALRITSTYPVLNGVVDEPAHIVTGLQLHQSGGNAFDYGHPRLPVFLIGWGPFLGGVRLAGAADGELPRSFGGGHDYWKALTLGRMGTLPFVPVLVVYSYLWGASLFGTRAGLAACFLATFSPNLLAHAGLATVDFAVTTAVLAAAFHLRRWALHPTWKNSVLAGSICGLAVLCKLSAAAFLTPIALAYLWIARWERGKLAEKPPRNVAPRAVAGCAAALGIIWLVYLLTGYSSASFEQMVQRSLNYGKQYGLPFASGEAKPPAGAYAAAKWFPIVPPPMRAGLVALGAHAQNGHESFLLGDRSRTGWWYYFPVALAVKTTLPLLVLIVLAAVVLALECSRERLRRSLYALAGAAGVLAIGMAASINIGIRHVLPIYPFLAVFAAGVFAPRPTAAGRRRAATALGLLLLAGHGIESAAAHPDYLGYFNQIARGREAEFLVDSNLDWGQDLARLSEYVRKMGIEQLHLSYFGTADPAGFGIAGVKDFGPDDRPTGWIAISASHLQGISLRGPVREPGYHWLKSHRVHARIGTSIFLYYLPDNKNVSPH
jgi:hypothetical protein